MNTSNETLQVNCLEAGEFKTSSHKCVYVNFISLAIRRMTSQGAEISAKKQNENQNRKPKNLQTWKETNRGKLEGGEFKHMQKHKLNYSKRSALF